MVISVSGMVGSGKTTVSNQLLDLLHTSGHDAVGLRFQALPCFAFLRSPLRPRQQSNTMLSETGVDKSATRWVGYRRKRLTAVVTLAYLARILAFRIYRLSWSANRCYVLNRYFFDLFAHYRLTTRRERFYFMVVRSLMPRPDLALVVMAQPGTIVKRRPAYSQEYLSQVGESYNQLCRQFPALVEIRTDTQTPTLPQLQHILAELLEQKPRLSVKVQAGDR